MRTELGRVMSLEVPLIVVLGERQMRVADVLALMPGAILELPKRADEELQLLVNNKPIATGVAVKVGENFGLRVTYVGDLRERIGALGAAAAADGSGSSGTRGRGGEGGAESVVASSAA